MKSPVQANLAEGEIAATISKLWRYPVKSMLGEEVESADAIWSGFYGNRCYALVDVETSRLVSAKNPTKWSRMFECSSRLLGEGAEGRAPPVRIMLPGGMYYDISEGSYGGAEKALTRLFGRSVRFKVATSEPASSVVEQYHPEIGEDAEAGKTTLFSGPKDAQAGTFTDMAAVHVVSTSSLEALEALYPEGDFDPLRFRPSILVDTGDARGFVESGWVGKTLAIGEVRLKVYRECGRCVMTTLAQGDLESDTGILRTIMRFNRGKLGVFASVTRGGKVKKNDRILVG